MFFSMHFPATLTISMDSLTPRRDSASCASYTHSYASSELLWTRTACRSLYHALRPSMKPFDRTTAAPPHRKSVFWRRKPRSLPRYRFGVMISVETTRAFPPRKRRRWRRSRASPTEMRDAPHPIPERLKLWTSCLIPNLDMTMAQRLGVGENSEQFITRTSTSRGWTFAFLSADSTTSNITVSASRRLAAMDL